MPTQKRIIVVFAGVLFLFMASCKESPKSADETKTDTSTVAKNEIPVGPVYDPAMDPLIVAPAFTKKIADTLGIKMFELNLKPGDSLPLHAHPDHAHYIIEASTELLYVPGQNKADTIKGDNKGTGAIYGPFTDAAKNIGKTNLRVIEVDVYRPPGIELPAKPAYDSAMDAFTLGGPSIQKIADSLGIKLFILTMKPGDTATLHSHPDHAVYVLEGGELAVSFLGGPRTIMKLQKGMGFVGGPLSDAAKNTGKTTIKLLIAHVYRPRPK